MTMALGLKSRVKRKSQARFGSGSEGGDSLTDHNLVGQNPTCSSFGKKLLATDFGPLCSFLGGRVIITLATLAPTTLRIRPQNEHHDRYHDRA